MSSSIKISELLPYPPPPLVGEDFFPIVDSSSMLTQRTNLTSLAAFLTASTTMSWARNAVSSSVSLTASFLLYQGFFNGTASYALTGGSTLIALSSSWASRSISSSLAASASYVVSYPSPRYVPYVDANNLLTTSDYFLRFDSASINQTFTGEPINSSEDVQILFNERQSKYGISDAQINVIRLVFKGTASYIAPNSQDDELVKIIAGSNSRLGGAGGGHAQKILGIRGGSSTNMGIRYYAGYRMQSSSFGSDMDSYGWNGIYNTTAHGLPTETYFPPYPVPVMELFGTSDYNVVKFKEGVCRSVRRYADAAITTESFWQPFSALRISLDDVNNVNTSGSVDTINNMFWIPHYRPYSNIISTTTPRIDFSTTISDGLYDYYESVNPFYIGQKVVIEPLTSSNGWFDTGSLPSGYFQKSGSFSTIVKVVSTGSYGTPSGYNNSLGFILECVNPAVIPDHIFTSGLLEIAPNATMTGYLGGGKTIAQNNTMVFSITSGSSLTRNRFLLTPRTDPRIPALSQNLTVGFQFSASFSPVYSVEFSDSQGISFYLSPMSCSTDALMQIGNGGGVYYNTDPNLAGAFWFANFPAGFGAFYSVNNYSHKITSGADFVSGRPAITNVVPGKTLKIKRTIVANQYENTSKTKQVIYILGKNNGSQISASYNSIAIGGIVDGFMDGQEMTIYNNTNHLTMSFFGRTHPFISDPNTMIFNGTQIVLQGDEQKHDLLPYQSINLVYDYNDLISSATSYWRVISTTS
jgi:hypothetical protein